METPIEIKQKVDDLTNYTMQAAIIKGEIEELKAFFDQLATAELLDTKLKSIEYWGSQNVRVSVSNSQTVKPVSMTMIKSVFGDIFTDFIKEETTYKMSEPCKRLFTMTFMGEYTEGKLDQLIEQISSDKQIQNTLKKKLKGKYEKDTVTLMNVAGLDGDNYRKLALKYKLTGVTSGTYKEIVAYLKDNGDEMSQMAVCNYAKKYLATVEMVNIAQTNFSMLMDEMNKYPDLDTSEALIRLSSHHVINALTSLMDCSRKNTFRRVCVHRAYL